MEKNEIRKFQKKVLEFYKKNGRHTLPWRHTKDPYCILVSELMLQQTQVERVIPKYELFMKEFPSAAVLAAAPLSKVLTLWSGLGYNRRARFLHQTARVIEREYSGVFPEDVDTLKTLPGIGPYTAGAIAVFAFNTPAVLIETNIRSVYLDEFFPDKEAVYDREILPYIEATMTTITPREWYAALMDYGTYLKKTRKNPSKKSAHHTKQSAFKGSLREVRGAIVPLLFERSKSTHVLIKETQFSKELVTKALQGLTRDGLVEKEGRMWKLAH
ncbi:A/G-specific adenine glycosylase [Candidatus Kaiserbacteria bacterium]|nr:MAG: A/G-specific adenine glycosylase [Candidatus Kaiserbacteria bacterium]